MNKFKVVKIVDDLNIVINAGANDVQKDDELEIYLEGDEVIDPDTGESLGTLDIIKARVKVSTVYEKMCLCKSATTIAVNDPLSSIAAVGLYLAGNRKPEPLNVDMKMATGGIKSFDKKIVIGDAVRKAL